MPFFLSILYTFFSVLSIGKIKVLHFVKTSFFQTTFRASVFTLFNIIFMLFYTLFNNNIPYFFTLVNVFCTINIPPLHGGYFIFGHSPNTTGCAQVRFFIGLPAMQLLLTTHKWVPWVKQAYLITFLISL